MSEHSYARADALVLLGVITEQRAVTEAEGALVGAALAGQDAQQAGLACAVQAHHQQALSALDLEVHVSEHERTAIALGQPLDGDRDPAAVGWIGESHLDFAFAFRRADLLSFQAVHSLEDRLRCASPLLRLAPHHLRKHAQALDLCLLALRQRGRAHLFRTTRREVLRVRAAILTKAAGVEVQHAGDRFVEENQVVADDDHRPAVASEEVHQP